MPVFVWIVVKQSGFISFLTFSCTVLDRSIHLCSISFLDNYQLLFFFIFIFFYTYICGSFVLQMPHQILGWDYFVLAGFGAYAEVDILDSGLDDKA